MAYKPCTVLDLTDKRSGQKKTCVVESSDEKEMVLLLLKDRMRIRMSYDHFKKNLTAENQDAKFYHGVPMKFVFWALFYIKDNVEYSGQPFVFNHRIKNAFRDTLDYKEHTTAGKLQLFNITTYVPKCGSGEHADKVFFVWWDGESKNDTRVTFSTRKLAEMYEKYMLI